MKKLIYLLFLCFGVNHYGQTEIFTENFETFDPRYGTNVIDDSYQCPSISFSGKNNYDCLVNWKTLAGTPAILKEKICIATRLVPPCIETSYLQMWSAKSPNNNTIIGEAAYIHNVQFKPNTNYRIIYTIRSVPMKNPAPLNAHFYIQLFNGLTPYYYGNAGDCGTSLVTGNDKKTIDIMHLDAAGFNWQFRSINFSTDANNYSQMLFYPNTTEVDRSQVLVHIDNIHIYEEGGCFSNTVFLQNEIFNYANPIIQEAKKILAGSHVTNTIPVGDYIVDSASNLTLVANETIDFENGFEVKSGANFDAYLDSINFPDCHSRSTTNDIISEKEPTTNEIKESMKISVYPNPSKGQFEITSGQRIEEIIIYNSFGEEIKPIITSDEDFSIEINLTNNKTGIYLIRLRRENEWTERKIIIN